jgi:Leucine-rich repeat (LRR) protein
MRLPEVVYTEDIIQVLSRWFTQEDVDECVNKGDDLDVIVEIYEKVQFYAEGFNALNQALRDDHVSQVYLADQLIKTELAERVKEQKLVMEGLYHGTGGDQWTVNTNWLSDRPFSEWHGLSVDVVGNITKIELPKNNLAGLLPTGFLALRFITRINFEMNSLDGALPAHIGNLIKLEFFKVNGNKFDGHIPETLMECEHLTRLDLQLNQFDGEIPPSIQSLANLEELRINGNRFSGKIPKAIANLKALRVFVATDNALTGAIPVELCKATKLEEIYLGQNAFVGKIPRELGMLENLERLNVTDNMLDGGLPNSLSFLTNLVELNIQSNRFAGPIPKSFGVLQKLQFFEANHNYLTGPIPPEIAGCKMLQAVRVRENKLTGDIPLPALRTLKSLKYLSANNNLFTGAVIATGTYGVTPEDDWTEMTWDPPSAPGTYELHIAEPTTGSWGAYGSCQHDGLMLQVRVKNFDTADYEGDWTYAETIAPRSTWMVPFSKHLTQLVAPRVQEFTIDKAFDGVRIVIFEQDYNKKNKPGSKETVFKADADSGDEEPPLPFDGGRFTLRTSNIDEARRVLHVACSKNALKIWF